MEETNTKTNEPNVLPANLRTSWQCVRTIRKTERSIVVEIVETATGKKGVFKRPGNTADIHTKARFERDLDILSKTGHQGIAPILACGSEDGLPYYVTPLGTTLAESD